MNVRHLAAACALLAAAPCLASVEWSGDFESGNLSQYTKKQAVSNDRLTVVTDPVRQGRYALKVRVKQGDNPIHASGNRNELVQLGGTSEGTEAYYRWSTMFAPDFPNEKTWQLFAQWHQPEDCCGSPPIQFYVYGNEMRMTVSTDETQVWHAPLQRGVWNDFVLHVRFSDDPQKGFVELWHNGKHVVPKTFAATRANAYLKLGLYRNAKVQQEGVLFHDGVVRADSLEDVLSPTAVKEAEEEVASASQPAHEEHPAKPPSKKQGRASAPTRVRHAAKSPEGGCSAGAVGGGPALALGLLAGGALLQRQRRRRAAAQG